MSGVEFLTEPAFKRADGGQFQLCEPLLVRVGVAHYAIPAGFTTDGASIPPLCWPIVGHPYSPSSLRAAVLHDWLCREHAHGLDSTVVHRVFYDALRVEGCAWLRSTLMHAAVRVFGPSFDGLPRIRGLA